MKWKVSVLKACMSPSLATPGNITRNIVSATMFPSLARNLGPLFFWLYINDVNNASTILQLILLADDTNAFLSHKDADCLVDIVY